MPAPKKYNENQIIELHLRMRETFFLDFPDFIEDVHKYT